MIRRDFFKTLGYGLAASMPLYSIISCGKRRYDKSPNVILIITDDQGYGDFGVTGNPLIRTPNIDRMARHSVQMTNFYVCPVCAPTRACLMTGRYNYRTRCIDTFVGRAMMEPEEVTIAEILNEAGYATGIFGKWHLGDNYPMRPQDQGFEESLVHRGGGIGQPSDPPGGEGKYTDPVLFHNGKEVHKKGYCTDIYFNDAIEWVEKNNKSKRNFFLYLPTNAPHSPINDVPRELYEEYSAMNLNNDQFPQNTGHPLPNLDHQDINARIFAMITNIDDNIGKLFRKLEELNIADNTIVMFLVDNGPNTQRYVAGMKGAKTSVYEGGIHSPLFIRWPERFESVVSNDRVVAHIDILPTILDACEIEAPPNLKLDGKSFLPLLEEKNPQWPDRYVVIQAHRGDVPVLYHNFAIRNQRYKLLHASGFGRENFEGDPKFELYDMVDDRLEMTDIAKENPDVVQQLKTAYEKWFEDVSHTRPDNYVPPRIHIGSSYENPVVLTRQDWRHVKGIPWAEDSNGYWMLYASAPGNYDILLRLKYVRLPATAELKIGGSVYEQKIAGNIEEHLFKSVYLPSGNLNLEAEIRSNETIVGPWQVVITRL